MKIRFLKDFPGSVETNHAAFAKGDEATVSDFAAGQLIGSGNAERADLATDPASPYNLAGPDGKPLAGARPNEGGTEVIAGVAVESAGPSANDAANLDGEPGPSEAVVGAKGTPPKKGKK